MSTSNSDHGARSTVTRRGAIGAGATVAGLGLFGAPTAHADSSSSSTGPGKPVARTPDWRFAGLADYPFEPHHVRIRAGDGLGTRLRMHYVDEHPSDPAAASGETILLLHGNPSWSYLYRHVIPPLVVAGHRCVAPDLVGFGKSDKATDRFLYTVRRHVDWLGQFVDRLDLLDVTLVCHDWGGVLGLMLLAEQPERFRRVVMSNTGLDEGGRDLGPGWEYVALWQRLTQRTEHLDVGQIIDGYTAHGVPPEVMAGYNAPFAEDAHLHGLRRFAVLFPITDDDEANPAITAAWQVLGSLKTPLLCVFSDDDHVSGGDHSGLSDRIPGAQGQPHVVIAGGGHFVQEDKPTEFATAVADFIRSTT